MEGYWNRRGIKGGIRKLGKQLQKFRYFEDCNYHVASVTKVTFDSDYSGEVAGISLFTMKHTVCALHACNPLPLTPAEAMARIGYFKAEGFDEYLRKYIYEEVDDQAWEKMLVEIHKFREEWRAGEI
jgi:hypothetical protein